MQATTRRHSEHADVVIRRRLRNQNLIPGALEPRSVLAEYDDGAGTVTVHSSTQSPHIIKRMLAEVLSFPEERLRVVAPDVGGGFGSKLHLYPEEVLVTALAIRLRRAVKWTATRSEDFQATNHGRDHVQDVELCATADGVITGIKATLFANLGAYLSDMAAGIPTANCATMVTGVYRIPNVHVDTLGVLTHTSRVDTYRGAGRPEATYLIERMVDQLARELRIDPADIRRRNFIPPDAFPYQSPLFVYDSGDYEHNLDTALDIVGYEKLRKEQAELRLNGRYRGIGLATYTEFTGLGSGRDNAAVGFRVWRVGIRARAGPSDRPGQRARRHRRPRPGARHQLCADRRRRARPAAGRHRHRRRGHGASRIRPGHVQLPVVAGRRKCGPRVQPEGSGQGHAASPPTS